MKIKKNRLSSGRIFELHLIKSRIYENPTKTKFTKSLNLDLNKIVLSFKRAISIIYNFNKKNKNILFVGLPKAIENRINKETNHDSVPNFLDFRTMLSDKYVFDSSVMINKSLKKNNFPNKLKNNEKPDLIVVISQENQKNLEVIRSNYNKIPVIKFNYNLKEHNANQCYKVLGNLNFVIQTNKKTDNILLVMLSSLLK